ncbi:MAG: class I adenylate-forming enzyme family protein, partial [Ilumatobacteraceae bacterium]
LIAGGSPDEASTVVHPEDTACIVYTSGTTGEPKGAELSHRALLANTKAVVEQTEIIREGDVVLSVMPLFHVGGMWYYAFPAFALGCKVVILREFRPTEVIETLRREACTAAHFVPTMIAELLKHDDIVAAAESLRVVFYAGSSIPGEVLRTALAMLSGCDLVQGYGSTESAGISFLTAADHRRALTDGHLLSSCGSPFAHVEVRIDEPDSSGIGEILVKSPNVMKGYWGKPDRTAAVLRDGWLYTGDLGRLDDEGHLFVVDRKNDMIVSGGENVYPFEVEEALREHPAVGDCAVFGLPDPRWVERVVAAVVVQAGAEVSADDIVGSARTRLAGYKCPKQVIFVDELPKSGAGKVLRKALREKFTDPAAV